MSVSESENIRTAQNLKLSECVGVSFIFERKKVFVRWKKCQNWKMSESESVRICRLTKCQNVRLSNLTES